MNTPKTWRNSPFSAGIKYRVLKDFDAHRDKFKLGEMLIYSKDAYSIYDSCTGYIFQSVDNSEMMRVWDVYDDENLDLWRELFQECGL